MRAVAPQVKTEQPVQFLDAQHDGFVGGIRGCFETFGLQALEPKAEAVALPVEDFHPITGGDLEKQKVPDRIPQP
jgi:hypothetical protein